MLEILVDADACPVKEEIYKVAFRTNVPVVLVSNMRLRIPKHELISQITVSDHMDAADDYIAEQSHDKSIVITADIPLASRCLKKSAIVLRPNGKTFTEDSIGMALATRDLMSDLRAGGEQLGGPKPFQKSDRSRFLSTLDETIVRLRRS